MIQIIDRYIKERYKDNYQQVRDEARLALKTLIARNGKGNDFLGWLDLQDQKPQHLDHLKEIA